MNDPWDEMKEFLQSPEAQELEAALERAEKREASQSKLSKKIHKWIDILSGRRRRRIANRKLWLDHISKLP